MWPIECRADAAVVIIGFDPPEADGEEEFYDRVEDALSDLPRVLLVHSAGGVELES